ncbi:outer membrane beta-barrel protein [Raineya orbicola]|uniref:Outer membrane protein beta-barrel domain n=1 Tax=Raineya orbicola TaxID=2016530 RepID=A0A2N3I8H5_9BACT|nr:outer membrane beta-barrel protein [Raineya orbicola]PKQ66595.1 Outer membrane protein beta-barrel domain [Raineya orbicola]
MLQKYFYVVFFVLFFVKIAFPQDTIQYFDKGKKIYEIYFGEKDSVDMRSILPRVSVGLHFPQGNFYPLETFNSRFWSVGLVYSHQIRKIQGNIAFGFEFTWNNLAFAEDKTLVRTRDSVVYLPIDGTNIRQTKLTIAHLSLPLMFYKNFKPFWRVGVGGYADIRLSSFTKLRYDDLAGEKVKIKSFSDYHLRPLRVGVQAEVFFKIYRLFARYDLTTLFSPQKAPDTQLFVIGIGLF